MKNLAFYFSTTRLSWLVFQPFPKPCGAQSRLAGLAGILRREAHPGDPYEPIAVEEQRHAAALPRRDLMLLEQILERPRRPAWIEAKPLSARAAGEMPTVAARPGNREALAGRALEAHGAMRLAQVHLELAVPWVMPLPGLRRDRLEAHAVAKLHDGKPVVLDANARVAARAE